MKLAIILVTPRKEAYDLIEAKSKAISASNIAQKGYLSKSKASASIFGFHFHGEKALTQLTERILTISEKVDAIILIADGHKVMQDVTPFKEALHCFLTDLSFAYEAGTSENFLRATISDAVSEFVKFTSFFNDHKFEKIFLLPTNIFKLNAWRDLVKISKKEMTVENPVDKIQGCIKLIRNKMSPKRHGDSKDRTHYFVDDNGFFFSYGHEKHARPETGNPPHHATCDLNSRFRFGRKYDHERHFNVSVERPKSPIKGEFTTCHGETYSFSSDTHLNIFPNNHIV
ncbi:hypothetical protein [Rhizobium sp.]|jgi:hypothetical protein|uniref:hypothetical protein n=1 Tax=Rhizobium sp. TaxID=391 RepID=UPI000E86608B|nr:hypothetical protein [Rhizobium sp.]